MPSNAVSGSGTVTVAVGNSKVHVDVRAQQLSSSTTYAVHLRRGSGAAIGDIVKTVGDLPADAAGAGAVHLE